MNIGFALAWWQWGLGILAILLTSGIVTLLVYLLRYKEEKKKAVMLQEIVLLLEDVKDKLDKLIENTGDRK